MAISSSSKGWRKYAAYPGQPEIFPASRLEVSQWQDLLQVVADAEAAGPQPRNVRACGGTRFFGRDNSPHPWHLRERVASFLCPHLHVQ